MRPVLFATLRSMMYRQCNGCGMIIPVNDPDCEPSDDYQDADTKELQ